MSILYTKISPNGTDTKTWSIESPGYSSSKPSQKFINFKLDQVKKPLEIAL